MAIDPDSGYFVLGQKISGSKLTLPSRLLQELNMFPVIFHSQMKLLFFLMELRHPLHLVWENIKPDLKISDQLLIQ